MNLIEKVNKYFSPKEAKLKIDEKRSILDLLAFFKTFARRRNKCANLHRSLSPSLSALGIIDCVTCDLIARCSLLHSTRSTASSSSTSSSSASALVVLI